MHKPEFPHTYDKVWDAVNYVLKDQGEKILQSNKETGVIVTDTCRWALNIKYFKYYLYVERINDVSSKLNIVLLAHRKVVNDQLRTSFVEPMNTDYVDKKVETFLERVKKRLEQGK